MAIVTLTELKSWLNETGSADDAALTALALRAEAYLEQETGRRFGAEGSTTEVRLGHGTSTLFLADQPADGIADVTSVETRTALSSEWETEDLSNFEVYGNRITRIDGKVFPEGERTVRIVYVAGYSTPLETARQAVLELCEHWWRNRTRVTDVGVPEGTEGVTPDKLPRTVWQFIQRYRGVPVGF